MLVTRRPPGSGRLGERAKRRRQRDVRRHPDEELPRTGRIQPLDVRGNRPERRRQHRPPVTVGCIELEGIADVVAAHLEDVERLRRGYATRTLRRKVSTCRVRLKFTPSLYARAAPTAKLVALPISRRQGRPDAAGQPDRPRRLLDPRRAVAEMVAAFAHTAPWE